MIVIDFSVQTGSSWVKEFFIDKAELFLYILDYRWKTAEEEAGYVDRLLESIGVGSGVEILDLGCGNGRIAINLAKKGYCVVGVDISPLFIEDARKKAREYGVEGRVEFYVYDAREIDRLFRDRLFDATIMYWTTILGYYLDDETNIGILRSIWRITKPERYLLILNHAGLDLILLRQGICGKTHYLSDINGEITLMEKPEFEPETAIMKNTWVFYRRRGRDLEYIDEVSFAIRIYALHEIIELARKAGWTLHSTYRDLVTLKPYRPGLSSINIVLKKKA